MSLTRRSLLLGTLLGVTACAAGRPPAPAAATGWRFADDRGRKISLAARPARVVAQVSAAAALWDFGVRPIAVFGPHKLADGAKDPEAGDIDVTKVASVGNVWDEFNVEQYIGLRPELLVAGMYQGDELWYVPAKSAATIEKVAPTLGIRQQGKAGDELIRRYEELAVALGGAGDPALKARFEAAASRVRPGPRVLFCGASPEQFWVCNPASFPDQKYLRSLGLDIVVPEKPDQTGYYETLSWENIDKYAADAIFVDARAQSMKLAEIARKPTWSELPAVKAGHVYPWRAEMRFSCQGYTTLLDELSENLAKVAPRS
ncbi:ABC transporter substrate-binding protein [Nonomuraea sp. NPDC050556]|uniref:ABC transporter substrate-binding protein n=1 Tax=Nonomuraea sp. NPDC050556 TaxID=3364369 RepID=UPI0037AF8FBA